MFFSLYFQPFMTLFGKQSSRFIRPLTAGLIHMDWQMCIRDSRCTADDLVAEKDRPVGSDITDPMMIDDFKQIGFFNRFNRLRIFIVINKNYLLIMLI